MRNILLRLIQTESPVDDAVFNDLALEIYAYQFSHNSPYRQFCLLHHATPDTVKRWEEIPPLPVTAFKVVPVACRPFDEASRIFYSSGTTHPASFLQNRDSSGQAQGEEGRSRHAVFDLDIVRSAILNSFTRSVGLHEKTHLLILTPSPEEAPHSSLSYMMGVLREAYGTDESDYYIHHGRLLSEKLAYDLSSAVGPVILLGTSFSFVHFIDFHQEYSTPIQLPAGSRLMDTGGLKGRARTVSRHWLYAMIENRLGIPQASCVNEYGMSEMTSQFYDGIAGKVAPRIYIGPPQTKWRILDPETLQPVKKGETGLLAVYDLANIDSALALLTEDLCRDVDAGFEFIGRAAGAQIKGCSQAIDALLQI